MSRAQGINVAPNSARLYAARAEAYHKLNNLEKSLQDSMKVVALKEQAAARMAAPTHTARLGAEMSAGIDAGAEAMLSSRPEDGEHDTEKLMGSLQLLADLMTRHPSLAQVRGKPTDKHTHSLSLTRPLARTLFSVKTSRSQLSRTATNKQSV